MVLILFDDDKEEFIEVLDVFLLYLFSGLIFVFIFKYSLHYFSFLEDSTAGCRSTRYITRQFFSDTIAIFSMFLRVYILIIRLNLYDVIDDILDWYYIFLGDFDDDEYFSETILSVYSLVGSFSLDNKDDRFFLLEDENEFYGDFFYMYFLL